MSNGNGNGGKSWAGIRSGLLMALLGFLLAQMLGQLLGQSGLRAEMNQLTASVTEMKADVKEQLVKLAEAQIKHRVEHPDRDLDRRLTLLEESKVVATADRFTKSDARDLESQLRSEMLTREDLKRIEEQIREIKAQLQPITAYLIRKGIID